MHFWNKTLFLLEIQIIFSKIYIYNSILFEYKVNIEIYYSTEVKVRAPIHIDTAVLCTELPIHINTAVLHLLHI